MAVQRDITPHNGYAYYRGCAAKRRLPSKRTARGVMRCMGSLGLNVYKCRFCGKWHVGHK